MKIHILGICGTFMGGLAILAKQLGHEVSGSDADIYPPMSDALQAAGIALLTGYDAAHLIPHPEQVIIGNALSRGNPAIEYALDQGLSYISGPQWLAEQVLQGQHVLAVAGTHGKTTTSSLLAWILTCAGLQPGYLIGGVAQNFPHTANLGSKQYFVVEADEYDTAFFDKRSKFMHYRPRTLIMNNLEYDHADIFPNLAAIKQQFQFLLRTVPSTGTVIYPKQDIHLAEVLSRGCWSQKVSLGEQGLWQARDVAADGSSFTVCFHDQPWGNITWQLLGLHNVANALAAIAAAHDIGVNKEVILSGLQTFAGVKRRMEVRGVVKGITVYDDFAHHPTAIATTIAGLRARIGCERLIAVLQLGSNTMLLGEHRDLLAQSLQQADLALLLQPSQVSWDIKDAVKSLGSQVVVFPNVADIVQYLGVGLKAGDHVLIMSNKSFEGIHERLLQQLSVKNNG